MWTPRRAEGRLEGVRGSFTTLSIPSPESNYGALGAKAQEGILQGASLCPQEERLGLLRQAFWAFSAFDLSRLWVALISRRRKR